MSLKSLARLRIMSRGANLPGSPRVALSDDESASLQSLSGHATRSWSFSVRYQAQIADGDQ